MKIFLPIPILIMAAAVHGEDWNHWRGPQRDGVVKEDSGWTRGAWPPKEAIWTNKIGIGASAVVVANGHLFTIAWANKKDILYCLDAATGKLLWHQSYACPQYGRRSEGDKGLYAGPSASPSFDKKTGGSLRGCVPRYSRQRSSCFRNLSRNVSRRCSKTRSSSWPLRIPRY